MSENSAAPQQTFVWRGRYINEHRVFSADFDPSTMKTFIGNLPNNLASTVMHAIVVDFARRAAFNTPIQHWFANTPNAESALRVFGVKAPEESYKFKIEPEQRRTRKLSVKPTAQFPLIYQQSLTATGLNVVLLRLPFSNDGNGVLNEFIVVGIIDEQKGDTVEFGHVLVNRDAGNFLESERALLRRHQFVMTPFGDESVLPAPDVEFDERVLSFCIRWHVARRGKRTESLFSHAVGASQLKQSDELACQLFQTTHRYFKQACAATELFANRAFLKKIFFLWVNNCLAPHRRVWMIHQIVDAVEYYVDTFVVNHSATKREAFFRATLLPALSYFMPRVVVCDTSRELVVEFCSPATCALQFGWNAIINSHEPKFSDKENAVRIFEGRQYVPISIACRLFAPMLRCALDHMSTAVSVLPNAEPAWLVDETVMPMRGSDYYTSPRTVRYDDYPIDGFLHRRMSASTSNSAATAVNLADEFGLSRTEDEIENGKAQSIPIRRSTQSLIVSRDSLHAVCSMPAIEELGSLVDRNPCVTMHKNHALPLCARQYTYDYIDTPNAYSKFDDRYFVYRFFASLEMDDVTHEKISEFMLVHTPKGKNHKREIDNFPRSVAKLRSKQIAERQQQYGETEEQATERSVIVSCKANCKKGVCPYAATAEGRVGAAEELERKLKMLNTVVAPDAEAVARIVGQTKTAHTAERGCMQEFLETRRKLDVEFDEKISLAFYQPRHYVYASAQSFNKSTS